MAEIDYMSRMELSNATLPSVNPWLGKPLISVVEKTSSTLCNAYRCSKIPSEKMCLTIRSELYKMEESMTSEEHEKKVAVANWSDLGTFDRAELSKFIDIHDARHTCVEVNEEKAWHAQLQSKLGNHQRLKEDVTLYLESIWNSNKNDSAFGVNIASLKRLSCHRWLSDDILEHVFDMLNKSDDRNIYIVVTMEKLKPELLLQKLVPLIESKPMVNFIHMTLNVQKTTEGEVFVGNGNHWTYFAFDRSLETLVYGDSLGWNLPCNLLHVLKPVFQKCLEIQGKTRMLIVPCDLSNVHRPSICHRTSTRAVCQYEQHFSILPIFVQPYQTSKTPSACSDAGHFFCQTV